MDSNRSSAAGRFDRLRLYSSISASASRPDAKIASSSDAISARETSMAASVGSPADSHKRHVIGRKPETSKPTNRLGGRDLEDLNEANAAYLTAKAQRGNR